MWWRRETPLSKAMGGTGSADPGSGVAGWTAADPVGPGAGREGVASDAGGAAADDRGVAEAPESAEDDPKALSFAHPGALKHALASARQQALAVYARYKLPLAPALYRRRGDRHAWRTAQDRMTAEERWAFVLDGAESGWRMVGLDRVGRIARARVVEVQMAADILALTEALRRRLPELDAGVEEDVGRAFALGRLTAAAEARAELARRRKRRRARLRAARAKADDGGATERR